MAHVQAHQPHQHHPHIKDQKDSNRPAAGTDSRGRQAEPAANQQTAGASKVIPSSPPEKEGLRIAGFPWQFVVVMSVVGLTVLAFIIKMVVGL